MLHTLLTLNVLHSLDFFKSTGSPNHSFTAAASKAAFLQMAGVAKRVSKGGRRGHGWGAGGHSVDVTGSPEVSGARALSRLWIVKVIIKRV